MSLATLLGNVAGIVISLYLIYRFVKYVGILSAVLSLLTFYAFVFALINVFSGNVIGTLLSSIVTVGLVYLAYETRKNKKEQKVEEEVEGDE